MLPLSRRGVKVVNVQAFGAFVELGPGREGLVHVSELGTSFIADANSVVKVGSSSQCNGKCNGTMGRGAWHREHGRGVGRVGRRGGGRGMSGSHMFAAMPGHMTEPLVPQ